MTCPEVARFRHAYCDGELDASTMLEVEGHLQGCPACRRAVEAEQAFREELRRAVSQEPVPPHVAEKLRTTMAGLDEGEKRSARTSTGGWRASWLALAASVLLIFLGGLLGYLIAMPRVRPALHPLVAQLVMEHMKFAPLENPAELSSGNLQQVAVWVQGRTGHRVQVPDYSAAGIRLLGGRVTRLVGHRAAYIVYEKGRNIISLFAFPRYGGALEGLEEVELSGMVFHTAAYQGKHILLWDSGDMTYALVSDISWDQLVDCALVFSRDTQP